MPWRTWCERSSPLLSSGMLDVGSLFSQSSTGNCEGFFPFLSQIGSAFRKVSQRNPKVRWTGDEQGLSLLADFLVGWEGKPWLLLRSGLCVFWMEDSSLLCTGDWRLFWVSCEAVSPENQGSQQRSSFRIVTVDSRPSRQSSQLHGTPLTRLSLGTPSLSVPRAT